MGTWPGAVGVEKAHEPEVLPQGKQKGWSRCAHRPEGPPSRALLEAAAGREEGLYPHEKSTRRTKERETSRRHGNASQRVPAAFR